jgi:hypothetical protein
VVTFLPGNRAAFIWLEPKRTRQADDGSALKLAIYTLV